METRDNAKNSVIDLKVIDFCIERLKETGHIDAMHIKTRSRSNANASNLHNGEYQYECADKDKYICKCGRRILADIVQRSARQ